MSAPCERVDLEALKATKARRKGAKTGYLLGPTSYMFVIPSGSEESAVAGSDKPARLGHLGDRRFRTAISVKDGTLPNLLRGNFESVPSRPQSPLMAPLGGRQACLKGRYPPVVRLGKVTRTMIVINARIARTKMLPSGPAVPPLRMGLAGGPDDRLQFTLEGTPPKLPAWAGIFPLPNASPRFTPPLAALLAMLRRRRRWPYRFAAG